MNSFDYVHHCIKMWKILKRQQKLKLEFDYCVCREYTREDWISRIQHSDYRLFRNTLISQLLNSFSINLYQQCSATYGCCMLSTIEREIYFQKQISMTYNPGWWVMVVKKGSIYRFFSPSLNCNFSIKSHCIIKSNFLPFLYWLQTTLPFRLFLHEIASAVNWNSIAFEWTKYSYNLPVPVLLLMMMGVVVGKLIEMPSSICRRYNNMQCIVIDTGV